MNHTKAGLLVALALLLAVATEALSQESASYRMTEYAFNAGGHPRDGAVLSSPSYLVSLDALGDGVVGRHLSGPGYLVEGGFASAYPPPGEVTGLLILADDQTLVWDPEPSAGVYNLYMGALDALHGVGSYGGCSTPGIPGPSAVNGDVPPAGQGLVYLVTVENLLSEEGTLGWSTGGMPRPNGDPCP